MISISILNIKDNKEKIKEVDALNSDYIHVDVMDGKFVNNKVDFLNLPPMNTARDIHLMVYDIKKYIDSYLKYHPEYFTFHLEATNQVDEIIEYIKKFHIKVGISICPDTDVSKLLPYLEKIDLVLVMSVVPGLGGQKFIEESKDKIERLQKLREENNYHYLIEVDGGVNYGTKDFCKNADILVVGSYITMSDNYLEKYQNMLK